MTERDFNEVWGDKEPQTILEAMRIVADGQNKNLPIEEVTGKLSEQFLIVPGDNEIGREQTIALLEGLEKNPEGWEALLDGQAKS